MLSKNEIKLIKSLKYKKQRYLNKMFVVEGKKSIYEFINSKFVLHKLFSIDISEFSVNNVVRLSKSELEKISFLSNPNDHLAIFKIPNEKPVNKNNLLVGLESINDPGNLGTIIRTCEWFGVEDIVCSLDSVDCYNPKVVQSAMGSLSRVNITYLDLENFLNSESLNRFGTFINGESVYENKISTDNGIVVFGNEANGISSNLRSLIDVELTIPRFNNKSYPESLNLSNSLGIILSEFSRKSNEKKN
ncbi:RNA methyltransferase [Flavobacteriaceae bacterium]|jgi:TrmH family RNA methyltransferase|nr:RNA methyltransferase [Flavobacteriaceae bacterium]MBT4298092.1 RNA methyltransferase [Flavobacteriaceae bacterium]MBT4960949.1 RNA methyltransferase [Flavobacteriaceae bacterium]MBT5232744.1 RNA methyltransferase [Flavobacteriaceae bacterium]MBT6654207.1 RNA methyltransferase [Flavobacteriaceae bacterium]